MNFSCFSLQISSISKSPFISISRLSNANFHNLKLTKFISNFYYSNSGKNSVKFSKSDFSHFQNSVITYESEIYSNQNYENQGYEYLPLVNNSVNFEQCTFKNCIKRASDNQDTSGGAILISQNLDSFPVFVISNSAFLSCEASKGGCIYAYVSRSYIKSCCYTDCQAYKLTNAILIHSKEDNILLEQNSFTHCPAKSNYVPHVITLVNYLTFNQYVNCTQNNHGENGVFHSVVNTQNNFISFAYYYNNTGKSGFYLRNLRNVQLRKSIIALNYLSVPIGFSTDVSIDFHIQYTQTWGNKYKDSSNLLIDASQLKVFQESSDIDPLTVEKLNETSEYKVTADSYFEPTLPTYFITELCIQHQDDVNNKTIQPKVSQIKLLSGIILIISIVVIVVIIIVLCFYSVRKKEENLWVSQQSQFD